MRVVLPMCLFCSPESRNLLSHAFVFPKLRFYCSYFSLIAFAVYSPPPPSLGLLWIASLFFSSGLAPQEAPFMI